MVRVAPAGILSVGCILLYRLLRIRKSDNMGYNTVNMPTDTPTNICTPANYCLNLGKIKSQCVRAA